MESSLAVCLSLMWCCLVLTEALPWSRFNYEETTQQQACGDKLADMLSLVCSGKGYNVPFRPERSSARRIRRQIVEECCKNSCRPQMLQLYCRAEPTDISTNSPIRKRSESSSEIIERVSEQDITKQSLEKTETVSSTQKITSENTESTTSKARQNYKLINLLQPSERSIHKQKTRANKSTQNDTTEEELFKQNSFPPLRHHKNHHHSKQLRARKNFGKTKREKNHSDESKQSFQIGTVKPYFAGRAVFAYRSNHIHQTSAPHS